MTERLPAGQGEQPRPEPAGLAGQSDHVIGRHFHPTLGTRGYQTVAAGRVAAFGYIKPDLPQLGGFQDPDSAVILVCRTVPDRAQQPLQMQVTIHRFAPKQTL